MLEPEAKLRIRNSFPHEAWPDVEVVLSLLDPIYEDPTVAVSPDSIGPVRLNGAGLSIPYRVYLSEPDSECISTLTSHQQLILRAILSRSNDGYIREKCVKELVQSDEPWIPPFVLQLLGEYVLPIIRVVEDHPAVLKRPEYRRFIEENPAFFQLLKQRIISYWNCYYRQTFPQLRDYPAFRMARSFDGNELAGTVRRRDHLARKIVE